MCFYSMCHDKHIVTGTSLYQINYVCRLLYKREPTLQANSKFGLCYTPCILTLIYGYTPYINLTIIMKQKQTHKQRRFQPLRTNYATFGSGYFGSIWTSVISK